MKVKDLLKEYRGSFYTIPGDQTVEQALQLMSGHGVSAVMITEAGSVTGIFTEQDLVRCMLVSVDRDITRIPVREVMSQKLIVAEPEDTVEDAMGMMMTAKIRHLPVVYEGRIQDMLCLEDLVKTHFSVLTRELHYLKDYISDLQDAAHD